MKNFSSSVIIPTLAVWVAMLSLALFGAACSHKGNPTTLIKSHGVAFANSCMIDALNCYNDLESGSPNSNPHVLLVKYQMNGTEYGHAMCVFSWPPPPSTGTVHYAYDATNASFPLPQKVDATDPVAVAKFMMSYGSVESAWWAEPSLQ